MKTSLHHNEVREVLKGGKRSVSPGMTIVYREMKNTAGRYAVVISKKRVRKSTKRNRIRRIIREYIRLNPIPDMMFVVIYTEKEKTGDEIRALLREAVKNTIQ